jgi:hypothetical protein
MRKLLLSIAVAGLAASGACATTQAKSPADRPNLEVPPVPPRVIEAKLLEPPPPAPVEEPPPVAPLPPRPRTQPAPRDTAKADPKPVEPVPTEVPPVSAAPAAPVPQLRTPSTVDGAEATRQIHDVIERAKRGLGAIDYGRLSAERRSQYDQAKLMVTQAENQLKDSNFELAAKTAEKADRLATELQGR